MNDGYAAAVSGYLLIVATGEMDREGSACGSAVGIGTEHKDLVVEMRYENATFGDCGDEQ
jgi:hypothetical protein